LLTVWCDVGDYLFASVVWCVCGGDFLDLPRMLWPLWVGDFLSGEVILLVCGGGGRCVVIGAVWVVGGGRTGAYFCGGFGTTPFGLLSQAILSYPDYVDGC